MTDASRAAGYLLQAGLEMVYPQHCAFCGCLCDPLGGVPGICRQCLAILPLRHGRQSLFTWERLPAQAAMTVARETGISGLPPIYCAAHYREPLREAVLRLKFADAPDLAAALAFLLVQLISRRRNDFKAVVAVPLHRSRLLERGYNQAELLAAHVADGLGIPDWSGWLYRIRETERQSGIFDRRARAMNLAGAFRLAKTRQEIQRLAPFGEENKPLLLIDDILTTGATLTAAAEPLRQAGQTVAGLVVASDLFPFGQEGSFVL